MISTIKLVEIKDKAKSVISTCKTKEQIDGSARYLELYLEKTEDFLGYNELLSLLREQEDKIIN